MALITETAGYSINELAEDLKYLTLNTKYKRKVGFSMKDDDIIATEKDARAVIDRINKAVVVLNKTRDKVIHKFNLV